MFLIHRMMGRSSLATPANTGRLLKPETHLTRNKKKRMPSHTKIDAMVQFHESEPQAAAQWMTSVSIATIIR